MKYKVICHFDTSDNVPSYDIVEDSEEVMDTTSVCGEDLTLTEAKKIAREGIASLRKSLEHNLKIVNNFKGSN